MGNEAEENAAAVYVFAEFAKDCTAKEHKIVEWVETMPEGRDNESGEIVSEARLLARDKSPVVDIVFEPEVNLMIPVLHHNLRREA